MFSNCALQSGWWPIVFSSAPCGGQFEFAQHPTDCAPTGGGTQCQQPSRQLAQRQIGSQHAFAHRIASGELLQQLTEGRFQGWLRDYALRASPLFADAPRRRILCLFQIVEALTNGFRIAPRPRDVLDPTGAPGFGRLDCGILDADPSPTATRRSAASSLRYLLDTLPCRPP